MKVIELKDRKVRELTHSQFIVYTEQVRAGKSRKEPRRGFEILLK